MEKNTIAILSSAAIVLVLLSGWWFITKTNSINIPNPGSAALPNGSGGNGAGNAKSSEKQIVSFSFSGLNPQANGVFDSAKRTITFTVPSDVDITSLNPMISVSPKATVTPGSGSFQDFTNPVKYTVTAEDGSTQIYTVIVNTAAPQGPVMGS
jgi:hypothetical protein